VVAVSLYVEELIAIDAKVAALRAAGAKRVSRSRLLARAAVSGDDHELLGQFPRRPVKAKRRAPSPSMPSTCRSERCRNEEVHITGSACTVTGRGPTRRRAVTP
jgi:hypothetical protein